jgi:hypothetical protein
MQEMARAQFHSFAVRISQESLATLLPSRRATLPGASAGPEEALLRQVEEFIDGICEAICSAWDQWQRQAALVGVMIEGAVASGGRVLSPRWEPLLLAGAPKGTVWAQKRSAAIAGALGAAWTQYQASISVPGLPWYPSFTAVAGPVAPRTPNDPSPLAALTQTTAPLSRLRLQNQMTAGLQDRANLCDWEVFAAIAAAFERCFWRWCRSTLVTMVMGSGPAPAYSPPEVPAGPVVGGAANMIPGGFV